MDSHYHLLVKMKKGEEIAKFIKGINGKSATLLNKMDGVTKRSVWYNYWDSCIRGEEDFWLRFNYIHYNPVKHGCTLKMEEYEYSSYNTWLQKKGVEWMNDVLASYPIVDFTKGDK